MRVYSASIKEKEKEKMAVNLKKSQGVSLKKDDGTSLKHVIVGMGWDVNRYDGGGKFDLDVAAFMTAANGKVRSEKDFIFFNNPDDADGSVHHTGDNRTGAGDGDDEQILVDLEKVPADIVKISFTCTIYDAEARKQTFGAVENAYIKVYDADTNEEQVNFDLTEDKDCETAIVVGELYRHDGAWKFKAIGEGFSGGLDALCHNFGIDTI